MGYIATDCRPWVVAVDSWMYGRQSLAIKISARRAKRIGTDRLPYWLVHIMVCVMHGDWVTFISGICFVCDGMCGHLHYPVGLKANLGFLR